MQTVYVSDLDGTLLRRDATLAASCREQLTRLLDEGEHITIASARSAVSMRRILSGLPLRLPVIAHNGAMLADLATGRALAVRSPPADDVRRAYEILTQARLQPVLTCWDGEAERLYHAPNPTDGVGEYVRELVGLRDPRPSAVPDVAQFLDRSVVGLVTIGPVDVIESAGRAVSAVVGPQARVTLMRSPYGEGTRWFALYAADATKGAAVSQLLADRGLADAELVGIGDETWDAPLFDVSHRRVAVANAAQVILDAATEVIGHHDEGSVARWIAADVLARRERMS